MGMFDYIDFEMKCPNCGELVDDFQSKDSACWMDTISPFDVLNFYSSCKKCGTWIEFNKRDIKSTQPTLREVMEKFDMKAELKDVPIGEEE